MGIALLFISPYLMAQDTLTGNGNINKHIDTLSTLKIDTIHKKHSPQKASLMSAFLPGLGQVYNKKYWKVPIIYVGLGTLGYFIAYNSQQYQFYRKAYIAKIDNDSTTVDNFPFASEDGLRQLLNQYRRTRDILIAGAVLVYALNIVDASVDAHLFEFDVSDNLSLHIEPLIVPDFAKGTAYKGMGLKLKF